MLLAMFLIFLKMNLFIIVYIYWTLTEDSFYNHVDEINKTLEIVKNYNEGNILVHCMMGASRSVGFVCLYLMDTLNINMENAYAFVKDKREAASINKKFYKELKDGKYTYEKNMISSIN